MSMVYAILTHEPYLCILSVPFYAWSHPTTVRSEGAHYEYAYQSLHIAFKSFLIYGSFDPRLQEHSKIPR